MFDTAAALRLFQRDADRLPAISSTNGGLQLPAARGDIDDGWRVEMVNELNRRAGIFGRDWPRIWGEPKRLSPSERYLVGEVTR